MTIKPRKQMEKRLYYPSTFNLDTLPVKRGNHRDKYLYFLHTIYMGRIKDRRTTKQDWIPVHSKTAEAILNKKLLPIIKKYWIAAGVIEEHKSYKPGVRSKGYRFTSAYQSIPMKATTYQCSEFREKVTELQKSLLVDNSSSVLDFLAHNLDRLRINVDGASDALNDMINFNILDNELYTEYHQYVTSIATGDYRQIRDNVGFRVHNNYCNFPSVLRFSLTNDDGEQLYNADLKNSQPLILGILLKISGVCALDALEYITDCETGLLYENVAKAMGVAITNRKIFKQEFFGRVLFGENQHVVFTKEWKAFKSLYPSVARFVYNYKDTYGYNALSIALQKIESEIIIDGVIGALVSKYGNECFALTIHDSVTTTSEYYDEVEELIHKEFTRYGIRPTIKKEVF